MNKTPIFPFRILILIHILILCGLVGAGVFARKGWLDWRSMVRQNNDLSKQIEMAHLEKELLAKEIKALSVSKAAQERQIRKVLGYVRPNEVVIELD